MVQILIATYNGEKYLEEQILSLINQTYQDIQILIRDDGSTDNTKQIIKKLCKRYSKKIVLIEDDYQCGSAQSNFMQLLNYATSDYVMFCDQDDYWFPEKVHVTLKAMKKQEERRKEPILVYSEYQIVDANLIPLKENRKNNQIYNAKLDINHLLVQNYVTGCTIMINKALYKNTLEYKKEILMHDWWLAIYAAAFGKIEHVDTVLMYYRQHGNNCVGATNVRSFKYIVSKIISNQSKIAQRMYISQAKEFEKMYGSNMKTDIKACFKQFTTISQYNKIHRMCILIRGRYLKSTLPRIIGQLVYI